jgi:hypothetical protein
MRRIVRVRRGDDVLSCRQSIDVSHNVGLGAFLHRHVLQSLPPRTPVEGQTVHHGHPEVLRPRRSRSVICKTDRPGITYVSLRFNPLRTRSAKDDTPLPPSSVVRRQHLVTVCHVISSYIWQGHSVHFRTVADDEAVEELAKELRGKTAVVFTIEDWNALQAILEPPPQSTAA